MNSAAWTISDHTDFELLVAEDEKALQESPATAKDLETRDRDIFLRCFGNEAGEIDRHILLTRWLQERRSQQFGTGVTPGEELKSVLSFAAFVMAAIWFLAAKFAVWSFFNGSQSSMLHPEPVNVLSYSAVCIGVPFALSIIAGWVLLSHRTSWKLPRLPAFVRGTIAALLRRKFRRIAARTRERIPHDVRWSEEVTSGLLKGKFRERRDFLGAEVFRHLQLGGLAFTTGILFFSWFDSKLNSRVFGWQTTDQSQTAEVVHRAAVGIAVPWYWFAGDGVGVPTIDQVRQTQFVRYHGMPTFPPDAASAWRSFLINAALFYGFLPRLLLYVASCTQARRSIQTTIDFENPRFSALWKRLTSENVQIDRPTAESAPEIARWPGVTSGLSQQPHGCVLVIPDEIDENGFAERIKESLAETRRFEVLKTLKIDDREANTAEAPNIDWMPGRPRIVVVQESFMPPVAEVLQDLKSIRNWPGDPYVFVALVGKPGHGPTREPPEKSEIDVWHDKVISLGDPNISVLPIIEE